jgi:hypothetical protein
VLHKSSLKASLLIKSTSLVAALGVTKFTKKFGDEFGHTLF